MITFRPCGATHGPHPEALAGGVTPRRSAIDRVAVMIDTCDAPEVGDLPDGVEIAKYVTSWMPKAEAAE